MYYYLTRDAEHLMKRWCVEQNLEPPGSDVFELCFDQLKQCLQRCFEREADEKPKRRGDEKSKRSTDAVELSVLEYEDMRQHLAKRKLNRNLDPTFWISLDSVYVQDDEGHDADCKIQITRVYEPDTCTKLGHASRAGFESVTPGAKSALDAQIKDCAKKYKNACGSGPKRKVYITDDGLYSAGSMCEVLDGLLENDVFPTMIICGLATVDGHEKLNIKLKDLNKSYDCGPILFKPYEEVPNDGLKDWVCERDFFLGIPFSGRTVGVRPDGHARADGHSDGRSRGIPYTLGCTTNLKDCASIEYGSFDLAKTIFQNSHALWTAIEQKNRSTLERDNQFPLPVSRIPRVPYPLALNDNRSFTGLLRGTFEWYAQPSILR